MPFRTMEGTLLRSGGGMPLPGTSFLYPEAARLMGLYGSGGQNYVPHLVMPLPGGGWGLRNGKLGQANSEKAGVDSLTNRMGDFLQHRLALVTFDPMQPPYDSLQTYGLEGSGSQATSLSSLESEPEKDAEGENDGLEKWGPKFHRLLDIFREHAREKKEKDKGADQYQLGTSKEAEVNDKMRDGGEAKCETEARKQDESSESNEKEQEQAQEKSSDETKKMDDGQRE